jgi:hypothetical protein
MTARVPRRATLEMVRLYCDRPHMRGFHVYLVLDEPGRKPRKHRLTRLLHIATLVETSYHDAEVDRAERIEYDLRDMAKRLAARGKDLKRWKKRFAPAVVDQVVAILRERAKSDTAKLHRGADVQMEFVL